MLVALALALALPCTCLIVSSPCPCPRSCPRRTLRAGAATRRGCHSRRARPHVCTRLCPSSPSMTTKARGSSAAGSACMSTPLGAACTAPLRRRLCPSARSALSTSAATSCATACPSTARTRLARSLCAQRRSVRAKIDHLPRLSHYLSLCMSNI